jgi:hypothetical protein
VKRESGREIEVSVRKRTEGRKRGKRERGGREKRVSGREIEGSEREKDTGDGRGKREGRATDR